MEWFDLGEDTELHEQLLEQNGAAYQLNKYFEELAECLAAGMQWKNKPSPETFTAMMKEIGDVENVTPYPRLIFGSDEIERHKATARGQMEKEIGGGGDVE